jgi:hypothetical protein
VQSAPKERIGRHLVEAGDVGLEEDGPSGRFVRCCEVPATVADERAPRPAQVDPRDRGGAPEAEGVAQGGVGADAWPRLEPLAGGRHRAEAVGGEDAHVPRIRQ